MEHIDFITMLGTEVKVDKNLLLRSYVEEAAEKLFKQKVVCTPCVFRSGSTAIGWQIESKNTAKVIAYMPLVTGLFLDYPSDFEYDVTIVMPLGNMWAQIFDFKVRYIDGEIEVQR